MPARGEPCLVLKRLSCHFGGLRAVDDVSLTVPGGSRHAVIGPNGAGKTTLFNVISGETAATTGSVKLFGADVTRLAPHRRAALGIARTFQITRLFPDLTVRENVLLACTALDRRKLTMHRPVASHPDLVARADALMDGFGLSPLRDQLTRQVSYGDQRKLEVALSMAGRPKLLLLDEPMAGLSPAERGPMQALIGGLDREMTVLLIEHDMDMAFAFAERITVMSNGRVLAEGTRDQIASNEQVQRSYLGVHAD